MGRPSLAPDQATRVVEAMRRLLLDRFAGNQTALARALGVGQPTVSSLLGGKDRPSFPTAEKTAKLLRVPVADLLCGTIEPDVLLNERPRLRAALDALGGAVSPTTRTAVIRAASYLPDLSIGAWTAVLMDEGHQKSSG